MPGFDIDSLVQYSPPRFMCVKCCALNNPIRASDKNSALACRVCKLVYVPTKEINAWNFGKYLEARSATIGFRDPIAHGQALARIAREVRSTDRRGPLIRSLFQALLEAEQFVHLSTYGISHQFIGAMKLAAQNVSIRAVVTNADASSISELKDFGEEAPRLQVHVYGVNNEIRDVPHQKLIVIDGLIAFKGSANLTLSGWRKADKGLDILEAVTDVSEVMKLHNGYFSPLWGNASTIGESVEMETIPF